MLRSPELARQSPASTVPGVEVYEFPDKNVLVDAAEAVAWMWAAASGDYMPARATPAIVEARTRQEVISALRSSAMFDLALIVERGSVPAGAVQAIAAGKSFDDCLTERPAWLTDFLLRHGDARIAQVAKASFGAAGTSRLVSTTEIASRSAAVLAINGKRAAQEDSPKHPPVTRQQASLLVGLLLHQAQVFPTPPGGLAAAVRSGALTAMRATMAESAGLHLAAINEGDPYWGPGVPCPPRPEGQSRRAHKINNPAYFGVDGEDLFMLTQLLECQRSLGGPGKQVIVRLLTSDYHAALAASVSQLCPARLYTADHAGRVTWSDHAPGGLEIPPDEPQIAARRYLPRPQASRVPTPAMLRPPLPPQR